MRQFVTAAVLGVLIASTTRAQSQLDSSLVGQRARVRVNDIHRQFEFVPKSLELRGTISAIRADTVVMAIENVLAPISIGRSQIRTLDVSRGVPSRAESALRRALWWGVLGTTYGYSYLNSAIRDPGHTWEDAIGTGATIGVVTGLIIGAVSPYERWRRVRAH